MSFPSYESYKESGVEWLGEVPEGWKVVRMSYLEHSGTDFITGPFGSSLGSNDYVDEGIPVIRGLNTLLRAESRFVADDFVYVSEGKFNEMSRCDAIPGDLIFTARGTVGKVGVVPKEISRALISPNQLRYRPSRQDIFADYLYFLFSSEGALAEVSLIADSVAQPNLNLGSLKSIRISLPSLPEQQTISAFLDRETGKIDALVAEQEQLIALLKEKRQAVISHAVAKGLNPDASMKDSGIEWLGEVPAGWEVTSIKRIASIRYGIGEPPKYQEEGIPLIRATNVYAGLITQEGMVYVNPADIPEKRIIWLSAGDIIVVRSGAYTGDSAIIKSEHCPCIAGFDMVVNPHDCLPYFLQYALLSTYLKNDQLDLEKTRAAQPHLNAEELGSCFILLPPSEEQATIVAFLDSETAKIDTLVGEARRAISLLKERRSALISAAVTGKIDVRHMEVA